MKNQAFAQSSTFKPGSKGLTNEKKSELPGNGERIHTEISGQITEEGRNKIFDAINDRKPEELS